MENEVTLGARLVTQNLLVSAASAETVDTPAWSTIYDLAAFIDLFCLCDRLVVLGREIDSGLRQNSQIGHLIRRSGVILSNSPYGKELEAVTATARRHLLTYLGEKDLGDFDELIRVSLKADWAIYGLSDVPDAHSELIEGDTWLRTTPRRGDLLRQLQREARFARSTTFLVRSFLYVAYGDVTSLTFVPDSVRSGLVNSLVRAEADLRGQLLAKMTEGSSIATKPDTSLRRISPLASVVFARAKGRNEIAEEVAALRSDLAPLRARLREAERVWSFGSGNEVGKAAAEWQMVADELGRSYGQEPHLVSVEQMLAFGKNAGDLADAPLKSKAWIGFLLGLPFDVARRLILRRPAIELHRIRRDRPGAGRLNASIHRLFGAVTP